MGLQVPSLLHCLSPEMGPQETWGFCAFRVSELLGFFQFLAQFRKAPSIGRLGLLVQHLACVSAAGDIVSCLLELVITARHLLFQFVLGAASGHSSNEIEHVEFSPRMTE